MAHLAPHTAVHRLARRFLEPAQDLLVLGLRQSIMANHAQAVGVFLTTSSQSSAEPRLMNHKGHEDA